MYRCSVSILHLEGFFFFCGTFVVLISIWRLSMSPEYLCSSQGGRLNASITAPLGRSLRPHLHKSVFRRERWTFITYLLSIHVEMAFNGIQSARNTPVSDSVNWFWKTFFFLWGNFTAHCCLTPTSGVVKTQQAKVNHFAFPGKTLKGVYSIQNEGSAGYWGSGFKTPDNWNLRTISIIILPLSSLLDKGHCYNNRVSKLKFGLDLISLRHQQSKSKSKKKSFLINIQFTFKCLHLTLAPLLILTNLLKLYRYTRIRMNRSALFVT